MVCCMVLLPDLGFLIKTSYTALCDIGVPNGLKRAGGAGRQFAATTIERKRLPGVTFGYFGVSETESGSCRESSCDACAEQGVGS